eukprot:4552040-Heterocapsa_arctica.AAC.1
MSLAWGSESSPAIGSSDGTSGIGVLLSGRSSVPSIAVPAASGSVATKLAGRRPRSHIPSQRSEAALAAFQPIVLLPPPEWFANGADVGSSGVGVSTVAAATSSVVATASVWRGWVET